jgi:hypothetical protein|mmetsp:Transcript_121662/g.190881  ORF Transcript_121662/g.190881 Transcript_121662/m.190881 type:complete len:356 (-) Transcript_121662:72-1139(-)
MAEGRFDDLLLGMAQKHKNSEELMFSLLSFFERRTDLFHVMETPQDRMGFRAGQAEDMFFNLFHHFEKKYQEREQPELLSGNSQEISASSSSGDAPPTTQTQPAPVSMQAQSTAASTENVELPEPEPDSQQSELGSALPEDTRKMMKHISTWNGAVTDKYYWSQSIAEVTVEVEVEQDSRAKEIQVDIMPTRLSIKCKGKTCLEGKLHEKVTCDQCMWHLDDGKVIISLEKQRQTWWKCVLEGDKEIDTTKVESVRTMDEYDGETQGAIRKIMFDQAQKAKKEPTSDQIRTAEMMKEAWNAPGSPFRGTDFDPTLLNLSGPVPDDFFEGIEKKRIEEARAAKEAEKATMDTEVSS